MGRPEIVCATTFPFAFEASSSYTPSYGSASGSSRYVTTRTELVKDRCGALPKDEVATSASGTRYGRVCASDGVYEGDLGEDGTTREGWGTLKYVWGDVYTGQFKGGQLCGYGSMTYADGKTHAGMWDKNERTGCGKFSDSRGTEIRDGNWFHSSPAEYKIDTSIDILHHHHVATRLQANWRRRSIQAARMESIDRDF